MGWRGKMQEPRAGAPSPVFPRVYGLQSFMVPQEPLRFDARRRRDHEPWALSGAAAADQWRHSLLRHALLHRKSRGSVPSLGRFIDLRFPAHTVLDFPF